MAKNDEGYELRKMSYPYNLKRNLHFLEDDENINNENINDNISYNSSEKNGQFTTEKRNDFINNENSKENKDFIFNSDLLIPEIMKIYQNAKKFDYNIDLINIDFKDFIHNFSFENDENKNTINISSNNISDNSTNRLRYISESFSHSGPTSNNSIENNNIPGKYIILENDKKQTVKNSNKCNCKNSFCLKFYCECFSSGKYCENCCCCNCKNKPEYDDLRKEKYKNILSRNPKAIYQINSTKKSWTCNCKFSNCQKKYCDCFQNNKSCTSKCRCDNCLNRNQNNNNFFKKKKIRRIRGLKNISKNVIYLTPKKRSNKKEKYGKSLNYNQSTAELTENNINNIKKNIFNNIRNEAKHKEISLKLNMNDL